jgi:hypothetical protein
VHPVGIDYEDILKTVQAEPEGEARTPWEDCDGWNHTILSRSCKLTWMRSREVSVQEADEHCKLEEMRGYCWSQSAEKYIAIIVTDDELRSWGNYDAYHAAGASKQVAREMAQNTRQDAIDQLVKWYSEGWSFWFVEGEFFDRCDSTGGVQDDDGEDGEYLQEVKAEIAGNIARQLEQQGHKIANRPDRGKRLSAKSTQYASYTRQMTAETWREEWHRQIHSQDWSGPYSKRKPRRLR